MSSDSAERYSCPFPPPLLATSGGGMGMMTAAAGVGGLVTGGGRTGSGIWCIDQGQG